MVPVTLNNGFRSSQESEIHMLAYARRPYNIQTCLEGVWFLGVANLPLLDHHRDFSVTSEIGLKFPDSGDNAHLPFPRKMMHRYVK